MAYVTSSEFVYIPATSEGLTLPPSNERTLDCVVCDKRYVFIAKTTAERDQTIRVLHFCYTCFEYASAGLTEGPDGRLTILAWQTREEDDLPF